MMDTQEIRERAGWYKAGANAVSMYSGTGVLVISAISGLFTSIAEIDASMNAISTALTCGAWIAIANGMVILKARDLARHNRIQVDQY